MSTRTCWSAVSGWLKKSKCWTASVLRKPTSTPGSPQGQYQIVMANQALHHFVELEMLFDKVFQVLAVDGFFLTDDMIGRNGHMRWPEALEHFQLAVERTTGAIQIQSPAKAH